MPDQMRGDCLSLEGHPALITPNMDEIGGNGAHFGRAYSTCPSCIPARRALLTGQFPSTSGSVGFATAAYDTPTLPGVLGEAGYHSVLVGRNMHQRSVQNPGYETCILGSTYVGDDEYAAMLDEEVPLLGGIRGIGVDFNGWQAKSWPLPEYLHPTNWISNKSREVIASQDKSRPLFLTASYYAPHPPLIPPDFFYQRYLGMDLPDRADGDWVKPFPKQFGPGSARVDLRGYALKAAQAAYFGLIEHIDNQLTWLIREFVSESRSQKRPWVILFSSDHGEMLGDHCYFRKCEPFEGSSRVPLLINSSGLDQKSGITCNSPVCLEDIMPTLLEFADVQIPDGVDGRSLVPILRGEETSARTWLHCEHSPCYSNEQAFQMMTDGVWKYIWRPMTGEELLFDLSKDPNELKNLAGQHAAEEKLNTARNELLDRLQSRPEGFVKDGQLEKMSERYPPIMGSSR